MAHVAQILGPKPTRELIPLRAAHGSAVAASEEPLRGQGYGFSCSKPMPTGATFDRVAEVSKVQTSLES